MAYRIGEELRSGTVLKTINGKNSCEGENVIVINLINSSKGYGDIYKVYWDGKECALRWYNRTDEDVVGSDQYTIIARLVNRDLPGKEFYIWPLVLVTENGQTHNGDLFGYVMDLIPDGFFEMKHFLRTNDDPQQKSFKTFHAMIWAGMNIVSAVQEIHHKGMSFIDLNPKNIVINPLSGMIRIMVGCDNISADNLPSGVNGMRGYMAPEIVRSEFRQTPNIYSDIFSLAIVLFRLFYMDHPMEGKLWEKFPMITDKLEDELYCIHPVYNMSTKTEINRPNDMYAPNVKSRMEILPAVLTEGFENTFVNGIDNVTARTPESKWLQILGAARDQLIFLDPKLETDTVVHFNKKQSIPKGCLRMTVGTRRHEIALYPMQSIFKDALMLTSNAKEYKERVGRVVISQGRMVMQNTSDMIWQVYDPTTKAISPITKDGYFLVTPGTQIQFDKEKNIVGVIDNPLAQ